MKKITAIVPAYNEAPRIEPVLKALKAAPSLSEIIVVDDGSTDGTAEIAERSGVRVVRNTENMGKGYSMNRGVALAQGEIIFFSDADIEGLTPEIVEEIIRPVATGDLDMFIGMSDRKWYRAHQILAFVPLLGGERALTRELWQKVPEYYKERFRIEVALNFYSIYYGRGYQYKILPGVTQTVKEKKYGWWRGFWARLGMFFNIFSAQLRLNFVNTPKFVRDGRWRALFALYGAAGTALSALIFLAIYFGPSNFVRFLFAEDLRDPGSIIAPFLLDLASITHVDTIALVGLVIFVSSISIFLLTRKYLNFLFYGFIHKIKNGKKSPAR